uniref:Uncharacterized protein n=1 Tax=Cacopsylla melanoneura TaxID=428564 RepID=A0A8D9F318_9HEMI
MCNLGCAICILIVSCDLRFTLYSVILTVVFGCVKIKYKQGSYRVASFHNFFTLFIWFINIYLLNNGFSNGKILPKQDWIEQLTSHSHKHPKLLLCYYAQSLLF